jgi:transcriptional regulator with XRE-family HTH domain
MEQKKVHHGTFLKRMCESSKIALSKISEMSGYSRSSLYRWFEEEELNPRILYDVSIALGLDIKGKIPEVDAVHEQLVQTVKEEKEFVSRKATPVSSEYYKDKYLQLLERHNDLQQVVNEMQARYSNLESKIGTEPGQKPDEKKD